MAKTNFNSEFCGNLPLHLINSIQPYGALMLLNNVTFEIIQVSENIHKITGIVAQDLVKNG